jgi:transposase
MSQERVTLSKTELKRVKVLERLLGGIMSHSEAAVILGISSRQLRRLKTKYVQEGEQGLIHGNRGRKPKHTLSEEIKQEVIRLYEEKYYDSNFCHYSQLLQEHEGIGLSPSSVMRILKSTGREAKRPQKRRPKKHQPRTRRKQAGMLWQIDATPYEWLGREFGKFALHAAIDDATGIVVGAAFTQNECMEGYVETMRQGIVGYGIPLALYSDKHTIFRSPNEKLTLDEELDGQEIRLSNFGKALAELGIEHIKANTPQAKGRIERLWNTLQDRLSVELRLLGIKTIEEANKALPDLLERHNHQYQVSAAESGDAYSPLPEGMKLEYVFGKRTTRKVGGNNEIAYNNGTYVPTENWHFFEARTTVEVRETFSGEVIVFHKGQFIQFRKIERALRLNQNVANENGKERRQPHKPAANHPWRRGSRSGKQSEQNIINAIAF